MEIESVERIDAVGGKGTHGSNVGGDSNAGREVYSGGARTKTTVEGGKYGSTDERDVEMGRIRVETVVNAKAGGVGDCPMGSRRMSL